MMKKLAALLLLLAAPAVAQQHLNPTNAPEPGVDSCQIAVYDTGATDIAFTVSNTNLCYETTLNQFVVTTGQKLCFEGATADAFELCLTLADPTADRDVTFPDATGTVVYLDLAQALTNKTLTAAANTIEADTGDSATGFFSAGALEHERGGLESDVSAYSGILAISGGATSEVDTSAEVADQVTDETGSGALVFGTSPTITTGITLVPTTALEFNLTGGADFVTNFRSDGGFIFDLDFNNDSSSTFVVRGNAAGVTALSLDEAGTLSVLAGLDAVGAVNMDYGSADVTDHTFTTDGTGTSEVVLPAGSIDGTEILDDTVTLTTDTSGNYVASITSGTGITGGDGGSEGAALTLAATLGTSVTLTSEVDGTLPVANGGTGATTLTDGGILLGSGTGAITALGAATNGQIPIGDGTTDPVLGTITAVANETDVTNGAGSITIGIVTSPTLDGTNFTGIPSSAITTEVRSMYWPAGSMSADGTQCADPAEVTINSGPIQYTVICTDNDASSLYGHTTMPDSWDGGTVTFELVYLQTAADTSALNSDVTAQCRGATETVSSTWGAEIAIDDAAVTGSNAVDHTTSAVVTPAGTCAAGDSLWWRWQLDATGTFTAVATLHILGMKMEFTSNVGD